MDSLSVGFFSGCIGSIVTNLVNGALNRVGWMALRSTTVGTDFLLGKPLLKRRDVAQYLIGELAGLGIGGGYGAALSFATEGKSQKRAWIGRGLMLGTISWTINLAIGRRISPRAIHDGVSTTDVLLYYPQHLIYGLVTTGLMELWAKTSDKETTTASSTIDAPDRLTVPEMIGH